MNIQEKRRRSHRTGSLPRPVFDAILKREGREVLSAAAEPFWNEMKAKYRCMNLNDERISLPSAFPGRAAWTYRGGKWYHVVEGRLVEGTPVSKMNWGVDPPPRIIV